ncbi:MAG: dUTP diphosphatase [Vampirovibrionales bacterium]|nr:dUTP diphosphatase [Vampirovibrionales bacterium]
MPTLTTSVLTINVPIKRLPHAPEGLPEYATPLSAGMDLRAAIAEPIKLEPMQRALIPTGLILMLPEGYEAQVRPRSGLSIKHGITLINAVGTIDADYRHELMVPLVNLSTSVYLITPAERIAQLLVAPVTRVNWELLSDEASVAILEGRSGGFGSTGSI